MQAVIMAGGQGTRLRELTKDLIPKPMIEIAGKPLLQWQIENLKANGFDDIIVVVGHLGDLILDKFGDTVKYFEEDEPLGTAGALPMIEDLLDKEFALIYGDLFFDIDFQRMIDFHHQHHGEGTLFVHPNSHPYDSDLIELSENYLINRTIYKDDLSRQREWFHNYTNAGIFIFDKCILRSFPHKKKIDLEKDVFPYLSYLYAYMSPEYVKDIGTVDRFYQVEQDIKNNIPARRNLKHKQKAIFLDRDGTINKKTNYVFSTVQFELYPDAAEAIKLINQSEYLAIVVTNQPVVARGECTMRGVDYIHAKMETLLGMEGAYLNDIFFCPHHPDKGFEGENPLYKVDCNCRKPKPGMIYAAAERYNIDLTQSWMIGDTEVDYLTGLNAGVSTVIIGQDVYNLLSAVRKII